MPEIMRKGRWLLALAAVAIVAAALACSSEPEVVIKEVEVPGETVVVEKEVIKEVQIPGETVVVETEVVKEVMVPGETVVKEVVKEVMVPGETVIKEVVKEVMVPGETVVKTEVVEVVKEVIVIATPVPDVMTGMVEQSGSVTFVSNLVNPMIGDPAIAPYRDWEQSGGLAITEYLFVMQDGNPMSPHLASSWEVADDGSKVTIGLKQGIPWNSPAGCDGPGLRRVDLR